MKKYLGMAPIAFAAVQFVSLLGAPLAHAADAAPTMTATFPAAAPQSPAAALHREQLSYAVGVTTARNLVKDGVDIDTAVILKGMNDAVAGHLTMLNDNEIKSLMNTLVLDMRQRFVANRKTVEEGNRKRGLDFLSSFAKQEGVRNLPDGVLVKSIQNGTGPVPTQEDTVVVSFKGTLVDGKEFDSTPAGQTSTFKVNKLLPGWRQALSVMPVGSHWKIVVPSDLAYGERGIGTDIGPNETLVFDVTLHSIAKAE